MRLVLGKMGLGEMVMMFAAAGGDVVRGECECGCGCVGAGGFVAIWIRCGWVCVAVGLGGWCCRGLVVWLECKKKYIKKII